MPADTILQPLKITRHAQPTPVAADDRERAILEVKELSVRVSSLWELVERSHMGQWRMLSDYFDGQKHKFYDSIVSSVLCMEGRSQAYSRERDTPL